MERPTSVSLEILRQRIHNDFRYHPPTNSQVPKYEEIRDRARDFAFRLIELVPEGRDLSLALTALEDVVMRSNAGIARGGAVERDRSDHPQPNSKL